MFRPTTTWQRFVSGHTTGQVRGVGSVQVYVGDVPNDDYSTIGYDTEGEQYLTLPPGDVWVRTATPGSAAVWYIGDGDAENTPLAVPVPVTTRDYNVQSKDSAWPKFPARGYNLTYADPLPFRQLTAPVSNTSTRFQATYSVYPRPARVMGTLRAEAGEVRDENGTVQLQGVNWHGPESQAGVPLGLETLPLSNIIGLFVDMGVQVVRIPIVTDIITRSAPGSGINYTANPELTGMTRVEILDYCITKLGEFGMTVILDGHRNAPGVGVDSSGVWYGGGVTEAQFIERWEALATRYKDFDNVVGFDPWNEPHKDAHWGDPAGTSANDWLRVSGAVSAAVLAIAPQWLAFIEGVQNSPTGKHWLGGQLADTRTQGDPVGVPANRLMYAPHEYQASLIQPRWDEYESFTTEQEYTDKFFYAWAHNLDRGYPALIGETGANLYDPSDFQHFNALIDLTHRYRGVWVTYWTALKPSNDSGHIANDDYYIRTEADRTRQAIVRDRFARTPVRLSTENPGKLVVLELTPDQDFEFNSYFRLEVAGTSGIPAGNVKFASNRFGTTVDAKEGHEIWSIPLYVDGTGELELDVLFTSGSAEGKIKLNIG